MKHTFIVKYNGKIVDEIVVHSFGENHEAALETAHNEVDGKLKAEEVEDGE